MASSAIHPRVTRRSMAAPTPRRSTPTFARTCATAHPMYSLREQPDLGCVELRARPGRDVRVAQYSRNMSPRWKKRVHGSVGASRWLRRPANNGRPSGRSGSTARSSRSAARVVGAAGGPRMRSSCAAAPTRTGREDRRGIRKRPPEAGRRPPYSGLNTPNAAATTSGSTWPSREPRLVKYAGPSGIATPPNSPGLGPNPRST